VAKRATSERGSAAQRYEIQIIKEGQIVDRRWFNTGEDAAAFASKRLHALPAMGAGYVDPID